MPMAITADGEKMTTTPMAMEATTVASMTVTVEAMEAAATNTMATAMTATVEALKATATIAMAMITATATAYEWQ